MSEEKQEKVMTKYDLKMQKRAEEKERAKKEQRAGMLTGILILVALVAFMASFPIRSWLTVNGTYIKVSGEKITRLEFDYNYNLALNNYMNQYGTYLSYMGFDLTGDLSQQMYSQDLSFKDFFEEMAVNNIIQNRALKAEAKAAGFTYDASDDYKEYISYMKKAAQTAGMTESDFVRENFGAYATTSRLKKIVMEGLEVSAYYDSVAEAKTPSDDEAKAYYEENRDSYDSIDYRVTIVDAQLPTEPTELADPVEEKTSDAASTDAAASSDTETYQPSDAEIEFAMKEAKAEATSLENAIAKDGELKENVKRSSLASVIREWLFDSARKSGDTTIIEDEANYRYYVLAFEDRYLDETPTVDMRAIILTDDSAEQVLEEWKNGAATEDSFAELADRYNSTDITTVQGGEFSSLSVSGVSEELRDWLTDSSRAYGDTAVISPAEEDYTYVVYYVGTGDAEWMSSIKNTLLTDIMSDYLAEITESYAVEDPKNHLNYLKVYAAQEAAAAESDAAASSDADTADQTSSEAGSSESASGQ